MTPEKLSDSSQPSKLEKSRELNKSIKGIKFDDKSTEKVIDEVTEYLNESRGSTAIRLEMMAMSGEQFSKDDLKAAADYKPTREVAQKWFEYYGGQSGRSQAKRLFLLGQKRKLITLAQYTNKKDTDAETLASEFENIDQSDLIKEGLIEESTWNYEKRTQESKKTIAARGYSKVSKIIPTAYLKQNYQVKISPKEEKDLGIEAIATPRGAIKFLTDVLALRVTDGAASGLGTDLNKIQTLYGQVTVMAENALSEIEERLNKGKDIDTNEWAEYIGKLMEVLRLLRSRIAMSKVNFELEGTKRKNDIVAPIYNEQVKQDKVYGDIDKINGYLYNLTNIASKLKNDGFKSASVLINVEKNMGVFENKRVNGTQFEPNLYSGFKLLISEYTDLELKRSNNTTYVVREVLTGKEVVRIIVNKNERYYKVMSQDSATNRTKKLEIVNVQGLETTIREAIASHEETKNTLDLQQFFTNETFKKHGITVNRERKTLVRLDIYNTVDLDTDYSFNFDVTIAGQKISTSLDGKVLDSGKKMSIKCINYNNKTVLDLGDIDITDPGEFVQKLIKLEKEKEIILYGRSNDDADTSSNPRAPTDADGGWNE